LAKLIARLMDVELTIKSTDERIRPKNSEVERLFCDNTKLLETTFNKDGIINNLTSQLVVCND